MRHLQVKKHFAKKSLDAILVSSIPNIVYLTNYSGFSKEEREAFLLIVAQPQGLTHKTPGVLGYILTDARYSEAVRSLINDFELVEISHKLPLTKALKKLSKKHKIKKLGLEENNLTFSEHKKISKHFNYIYHHSVSTLRTIKSQEEIEAIEKACQLGDKAFEFILKKIKLGVSEKELTFEIEFFIKKNGADISFPSIVAFGPNSAIPHHQTSDKQLVKSDKLALLDFGVKLNNYCSDMTRTIFFGKPTREQKRMYKTVLDAQQKALEYLHENRHSGKRSASRISYHDGDAGHGQHDVMAKASEVDRVAREYIVSRGYKTVPHSLGHGIGLEIHESPRLSPKSKDILKKNMVFTIEPGIYLPGIGGVRIEDMVVLEKSKIRILTKSPKEIIIL